MEKTITLVRHKDCKHSVVYEALDKDAVLKSVYLLRTFANPMPDRIEIVVRPVLKAQQPAVQA